MAKRIDNVIEKIREVEKKSGMKEGEKSLLQVAFTASMIVSASGAIDTRKLAECPRRELYSAWIKAHISRSLGRLTSQLMQEGCVEWPKMDEDRLRCVLRFCQDLATCEPAVEVLPHLHLQARVHRVMRVGAVCVLQLGDLPRKYNRRLLQAAPLRLESVMRDSAQLSFRHSTVHDHLMAEKVME
eukprot:gene13481-41553_t